MKNNTVEAHPVTMMPSQVITSLATNGHPIALSMWAYLCCGDFDKNLLAIHGSLKEMIKYMFRLTENSYIYQMRLLEKCNLIGLKDGSLKALSGDKFNISAIKVGSKHNRDIYA